MPRTTAQELIHWSAKATIAREDFRDATAEMQHIEESILGAMRQGRHHRDQALRIDRSVATLTLDLQRARKQVRESAHRLHRAMNSLIPNVADGA